MNGCLFISFQLLFIISANQKDALLLTFTSGVLLFTFVVARLKYEKRKSKKS